VRTIYKPTESTALFAVNEAFARQDFSGCEALPLKKNTTERKYTTHWQPPWHGSVYWIFQQ
jgi:hypothetical protein